MSDDYKIPECDTFGYCVKCGLRMVDYIAIEGIYKLKLSGDYTTVNYKLNDGSSMRVAMCRHCADNLTGDRHEIDTIMAKVWRGWQNEVETYSHWSDEKKKLYLEEYSKKRIITRSDHLPSDVVEKIFDKYKELEPKEIEHIIDAKKKSDKKLLEKTHGISH